MSRQNLINPYINRLSRQIAETAAKIKHKQNQSASMEINADFLAELFNDRVEAKAYKPVGDEGIAVLLGKNVPTDSEYAAETYGQISNVDKKPTVVEGLVFENNREFDFKV